MMWRCLSDLGGQSDLWADVDARTTRGGSVWARLGMYVPMWHTLSPHKCHKKSRMGDLRESTKIS